jgi:hypothetical protein
LGHLAAYYNHPKAKDFYDYETRQVRVPRLRYAIAAIIERHWEIFSLQQPEMRATTRARYLAGVRSDAYGGEPELEAALEVFQGVRFALWVWQNDARVGGVSVLHSIFEPNCKRQTEQGAQETWNIYSHGEHYSWMSRVGDAEMPMQPRVVPSSPAPDSLCGSTSSPVPRRMHKPNRKDPLETQRREGARRRHNEWMEWTQHKCKDMECEPPPLEPMDEATRRAIERMLARDAQEESDHRMAMRMSGLSL